MPPRALAEAVRAFFYLEATYERAAQKIQKNQEVQVLDGGPDPHRRGFVQRNGNGGGFAEAPPARGAWYPYWATLLPQKLSALGRAAPLKYPFFSPPPSQGVFFPLYFPASPG